MDKHQKINNRIELINKLTRMKNRINNGIACDQQLIQKMETACINSTGNVKSILKRDIKKKRGIVKKQQRYISYIDKSINQVLTS